MVYFAVIPSLLPGTRNFPYREDNKTWGGKKEESNTFLNITGVTLLTYRSIHDLVKWANKITLVKDSFICARYNSSVRNCS